MKKEGKIIKFDGFCGTILDNENKEYFMPNEEIMSDKASKGDELLQGLGGWGRSLIHSKCSQITI